MSVWIPSARCFWGAAEMGVGGRDIERYLLILFRSIPDRTMSMRVLLARSRLSRLYLGKVSRLKTIYTKYSIVQAPSELTRISIRYRRRLMRIPCSTLMRILRDLAKHVSPRMI